MICSRSVARISTTRASKLSDTDSSHARIIYVAPDLRRLAGSDTRPQPRMSPAGVTYGGTAMVCPCESTPMLRSVDGTGHNK